MNRFALAACFATLTFPAALFAEPATQAGADELTALFQSYLGTTTGAVSVVPQGETYALTIDATPALSAIRITGYEFNMTPLDFTLTDLGNGTWSYAMDQPVSFSYSLTVDDPVSVDAKYGAVKASGIFDEALGSTSSGRFEVTDIVTTTTQYYPLLGDVVSTQSVESQVSEVSAKQGADGVDMMMHAISVGATQETVLPLPGKEPFPISIEVAQTTADLSITGQKPKDVLNFWAWLVAQSNLKAIVSEPHELKAQIEKNLPFFTNADLTVDIRDISATTPLGIFAVDELGISIATTGVVADGQFHQVIEVKGFVPPEGLVPDFAKGLIPTDLSLGFTVTDFDPSGAAYVVLKMLDQPFGSPPPAGFEEALLASLLPDGAVTVTLDPGAVTGRDYKLTYEGALTAGPAQPDPTFTARLALTGMEAIRTAMQSAPPELELGTAAMGLGAMGGLAKPGAGGELVWEIALDEAGTVLVNGLDVEKMFGNQ